jgi:hypothetical protein
MTRMPKWCALFSACVFVVIGSVFLVGGSQAQASGSPVRVASGQTTTHGAGTSQFSLTVSPTRLNVGRAAVGDIQRVQLVNGGRSPLTVTVQKQNFSAAVDGSMVFQSRAPYSASNWVTASPTNFVLKAGRTQTVTVTISIPSSPEPGDHQVALVFLVPAPGTGANIKINRGIAIPVYVTVPGPINTSADISNLKAPGFASGGPVTITAEVHDTGTVHRDFRGATILKVTDAGAGASFPDFTVMRDSTRDISTTWNPPLLCLCHPKVSMVSANGTVQSVAVRVIVFPLRLFGIVVGAVLVLLIAIRWTRRRYRTNVTKAAARMSSLAVEGKS